MTKRAMYLSGGGARGAYQIGVLSAMREWWPKSALPTPLLSSVSVGAINASYLAQYADNFNQAVTGLEVLWRELHPEKIFACDTRSLLSSLCRNARGFLFHAKGNGYLLNSAPLLALLTRELNFETIKAQVDKGLCELELSSLCYEKRTTFSFYQSRDLYSDWQRMRHEPVAADLSIEHVLASSALPLFFSPVNLDGFHYADGGVRLSNPLRALIKMKADKILVIGTRQTPFHIDSAKPMTDGVSFSSQLGQMLNALFLDNLDRDMRQITHINQAVQCLPATEQERLNWRHVDVLDIRPSRDLGEMALQHKAVFGGMMRFLLRSMGGLSQSGDIMSFLMFDGEFCQQLMELGYDDAQEKKQAIIDFIGEE